MIDLHTHSLLSDGELLPSELARRAWRKGYAVIAITDHVDCSNIDFVLPRLVRVSKVLNKSWPIKVLPGVEITHAPLEEIRRLVVYARRNGARIVVGHGETLSEPVLEGTNRAFIEARADIIAHPGNISDKELMLARKNNVYIEITTRRGHFACNKHVARAAKRLGANMVLDTDSHSPEDLITDAYAVAFLKKLKMSGLDIKKIFNNSLALAERKR